MTRFLAATALSLLAACAAPAQEPVRTPAPIPAPPGPLHGISPEEVEALREGEGMGQARAAELNGYPGPKHALELADSLALSAEQRVRVEQIRAHMQEEARSLGAMILAGEAGLEASFRLREMTGEELDRRVLALGEQRARLRLAHLRAHLETAAVLTVAQREAYYRQRPGRGHH
jgi:hypothetical protein